MKLKIAFAGGLCAILLGGAAGKFLELSADMSAPRPIPALITALDPNYKAYLMMLASLGPPPARRAYQSHGSDERNYAVINPVRRAQRRQWIEDDNERYRQDRWSEPESIVVYEIIETPLSQPSTSYLQYRGESREAEVPPVYHRRVEGESVPPPPPLPSGY